MTSAPLYLNQDSPQPGNNPFPLSIMRDDKSEMVQDAMLAIPFLDVPVVSDAIETERKVWQDRFQEFLKEALGG